MADLTDHNMERLSRLFASGNMRHAREIARLLNLERTEQYGTKADPLSRLLEDFLHGLARSQPVIGTSSSRGAIRCWEALWTNVAK